MELFKVPILPEYKKAALTRRLHLYRLSRMNTEDHASALFGNQHESLEAKS